MKLLKAKFNPRKRSRKKSTDSSISTANEELNEQHPAQPDQSDLESLAKFMVPFKPLPFGDTDGISDEGNKNVAFVEKKPFCDVCKLKLFAQGSSEIDPPSNQPPPSRGIKRLYAPFATLHESLDRLRASTKAGCVICMRVSADVNRRLVRVLNKDMVLYRDLSSLDRPKPEKTAKFFSEYSFQIVNNQEFILHIWHSLMSEHETCWFQILRIPSIAVRDAAETSRMQTWTGHQSVAEFARQKLIYCQQNHERCRGPDQRRFCPSRLLDVSGNLVRLVFREDVSVAPNYATLSHVWGSRSFLTLNSSTMAKLRNGVELQELPKTFRDAVLFSRNVGIRYIWIGSCCILQGMDSESLHDWEIESAQMGEIYTHAVLNIGDGNDTREGSNGLFVKREQSMSREIAAVRWKPTSSGQTEYFNLFNDEFSIRGILLGRFERCKLFDRGWVVQEYVLCRRMVIFADESLVWQCFEEEIATETLPVGLLRTRPCDYLSKLEMFWALVNLERGKRSRRTDGRQEWAQLLDFYTQAELSYPTKDKVRAIDGLCSRLAEICGDEYRHGFLMSTLPMSLGWYVNNRFSEYQRLPDVPSWHWASYNNRISIKLSAFTHPREYEPDESCLSRLTTIVDFCKDVDNPQPNELGIPRFLACIGKLIPILDLHPGGCTLIFPVDVGIGSKTIQRVTLFFVQEMLPNQPKGSKNSYILPLFVERKEIEIQKDKGDIYQESEHKKM